MSEKHFLSLLIINSGWNEKIHLCNEKRGREMGLARMARTLARMTRMAHTLARMTRMARIMTRMARWLAH